MSTSRYFIGLMTGTSLDGVDATIVDFSDIKPRMVAAHGHPLSDELRSALMRLQAPSENELHLAQLAANKLAGVYADAVLALLAKAGLQARDIVAIGNHGQTVRHRPELGFSVQLGNHARLAELTGITVVSDFRSRDIAAGGQGAPLVPAFHQALFGGTGKHRVLVNIGGIANLTDLPASGKVTGFDTGPGNVLIDMWIQRHQGERFDAGGAWGASGTVIPDLLQWLLAEPYFSQPAPKSTGRDLFDIGWLEAQLTGRNDAPADIQATLTALTADSIVAAIKSCGDDVDEVYLCGGGAHNPLLMARIAAGLAGVRVGTTEQLGLDPDWVEAYAFAWLAERCLARKPANLPAVTGAHGPRVLGAIWPA
ncbi:anhydro-N-acetylmuramic acid kinase [Andreprevotia lacus DSM 23236]|jgi:anhydro-N-acetylmuramic acid kinase|uniref:Anhydro-N-acetylmuramic acid kinase n=1 Tax=Andreprevotia lacus DSM 23236 TaxID=1121001 RepID=A0A1W1XJG7_9NEIS|nr:anhydro-N-acetylmuramic acid kinase [Andreprevotia lacus]SMC23671.1 anhydro-N-acetylmuramic acid kinase [Andreprevotia lacus DSM 23236]